MGEGPAFAKFESLQAWSDLESLIEEGEAEDQYLDCKVLTKPEIQDISKLSKTISGFANASGGVIIWGAKTSRGVTGGDVITDLVKIGHLKALEKKIDSQIRLYAYPVPTGVEHRCIKERLSDRDGIIISYVPPTQGDPVQDLHTHKFWMRIGEDSKDMPYEVLRKMFSGTKGPALRTEAVRFGVEERLFSVTLRLQNDSTVATDFVSTMVTVENHGVLGEITSDGFKDERHLNDDRPVLFHKYDHVFKGFGVILGSIKVRMPDVDGPWPPIQISTRAFANHMAMREQVFLFQVYKNGKVVANELKFPT